MPDDTISVFISYSHDSPSHEALVLALADRLRADGIDAMIDQYQAAPPEGWQLWMEKQIRDSKFVLSVCTETYHRRVMKEDAGKGLGMMWESTIIYSHLYESGVVNEKFIPIVFDHADTKYIPTPLKPTTYYFAGDDAGYKLLYRRLTNQPVTPAPSIGTRRVFPPLPRPTTQLPNNLTTQQPNLVHPYALQSNFTGRVQERAELTAWLADDAHPICALVAMGGMGKSAVAWYWLTQDILKLGFGNWDLHGVMWWSFYEGEASFAKFVDEALKYVSGQEIDTARLPTTYDRALELRRELQSKRVLFILDGFERQLRAYARLDAAYQRDDATESSREARACVEPDAARLLKDIAAGTTRAKVLITSRLMVSDLEDRAGDPLAGVRYRELNELGRDDAIAFMRAQGVKQGTPAEIATVCEAYGNHPLSLRLLSGLIARDTRTPGDIAAAPRHDVHADLVQRQHHILEQSYNALPENERTLLSRLAAFRNAMTYDDLTVFDKFAYDTLTFLDNIVLFKLPTRKKFDDTLNNLQARGLVQHDVANNRYDLHPIVRWYAYNRLRFKSLVHGRLAKHYFYQGQKIRKDVGDLDELIPFIEQYHHDIRAEKYVEAYLLYFSRLNDPLFYKFGTYQTIIELLNLLTVENLGVRILLNGDDITKSASFHVALCQGLCGQPRLAAASYSRMNRISPMANYNHATFLFELGELKKAQQNFQKCIDLSRRFQSQEEESVGHARLAYLSMYEGNFSQADKEIEISDSVWLGKNDRGGLGHNLLYKAWQSLLTGASEVALEQILQAREFVEINPLERDIIWAEWLWGAALVMEGKNLNSAATHLTEALTRCRRINLVEFEPDILLAWARWHRIRERDAKEAKAFAEEALAIADRCEYRLKQAEIHNFLARLALDADNRAAARQHAEIAKERAWCDGPPHCYKPALDEAEKTLKEIGH